MSVVLLAWRAGLVVAVQYIRPLVAVVGALDHSLREAVVIVISNLDSAVGSRGCTDAVPGGVGLRSSPVVVCIPREMACEGHEASLVSVEHAGSLEGAVSALRAVA